MAKTNEERIIERLEGTITKEQINKIKRYIEYILFSELKIRGVEDDLVDSILKDNFVEELKKDKTILPDEHFKKYVEIVVKEYIEKEFKKVLDL